MVSFHRNSSEHRCRTSFSRLDGKCRTYPLDLPHQFKLVMVIADRRKGWDEFARTTLRCIRSPHPSCEDKLSRGDFAFLGQTPPYIEADKDWYVELLNCTYVWFDSIIDPMEGFDTASMMRKYLQDLKEEVQRSLDKHFVYYLASRVRVRFSTKKKLRYGLFDGKLIFFVEIGRERKLQKYAVVLRDSGTGEAIRPKVELTDRYITIHNEVGGKTSLSVYDFLDACGIETGIATEVQYVGYTKNPSERPLGRDHRGFGDMMHWTSRDDEAYDYFIFYNLFKVLSLALSPESAFNFVFPNSMTDEVDVSSEGLILEKVLIKYFGAKPQELNKERESSELNNRLETLAARHRINSITFDLSMARPSELFRFFSRRVKPNDRHHFTCQIGASGAEITSPKDFGLAPLPFPL